MGFTMAFKMASTMASTIADVNVSKCTPLKIYDNPNATMEVTTIRMMKFITRNDFMYNCGEAGLSGRRFMK
jgi:hypothetical protein